jgi:hypothetical protein
MLACRENDSICKKNGQLQLFYDLAPSKSTFIKNGFLPVDAQKKYFFFIFFLEIQILYRMVPLLTYLLKKWSHNVRKRENLKNRKGVIHRFFHKK